MKVAFAVLLFAVAANAKTSAIDAKYKAVGEATLGKPAGAEKASAGGRVRVYENGAIYSSSATGTHAVFGAAYDTYKSLGAEKGKLGFPVTDVLNTPDGTQTLFRHGYILVGKSGAVDAEVTPKATFSASSVNYGGGEKPKATSPTSFLLPAPITPPSGSTVTCGCSAGQRLDSGTCSIKIVSGTSLRCTRGSCSNSCQITIVKQIQ